MTSPHKEQIELSVSSHPRQMTIVRAVTTKASGLAGFGEREQSLIALAVDEVCTNIIKYAYRNDHSQSIRLRFSPSSAGIEIVVRDFGRKPAESVLRPKRAGTTRLGGLGMHFVLSIMDTVIYDTSPPAGTVLTLIKALPVPGAEETAPASKPRPGPVTVIVGRRKNGDHGSTTPEEPRKD